MIYRLSNLLTQTRASVSGLFVETGTMLSDVVIQTSTVLIANLPATLCWTLFWIIPLMLVTLFVTTFLQLQILSIGYANLATLLALLVPFVISFWLQIPLVRMALDHDTAVRSSLRVYTSDVLRMLPIAIIGGTVLFAYVMSGMLLVIIPGVWLLLSYYVFMQAAMVNQTSIMRSLQKARQIVKGYRFTLASMLLAIAAAEAAIQTTLSLVLLAVSPSHEYGVFEQTIVHGFFIPVQAVMLTVFCQRRLFR